MTPVGLAGGLTILLAWLLHSQVAAAGPDGPDREAHPAVGIVFFYASECPHCHDTMEDVLAPPKAEHGDRLAVLGINASTEQGHGL
ncbi:hypothetical protein BH23VER1_BH23VER1_20970 [soil metagenome]